MKKKIVIPFLTAYAIVEGLDSIKCKSYTFISAKHRNLTAVKDAINARVAVNEEVIANGGKVDIKKQTIEVEFHQVSEEFIESLGEFECTDMGYLTIADFMTIKPEVEETTPKKAPTPKRPAPKKRKTKQ